MEGRNWGYLKKNDSKQMHIKMKINNRNNMLHLCKPILWPFIDN